jgi:AbrB family looped-hinge helix DNA binding protein
MVCFVYKVILIIQVILEGILRQVNLRKDIKMSDFPKFYGKVSVGTKGQIVIPVEVRRMMNIRPGGNLIIMSGPPHEKKMVSIIPEEEFGKFLKFFEEHVTNLKKAVSK